jgi:histidine kinase
VRWLTAPATVLVAVLGVMVVALGRAHPDDVVGGGAPIALALELSAGLAGWTAGVCMWLRWDARWAGVSLASAGLSVFLTAVAAPAVGWSVVFTLGLLGTGLVPVLAGAAALAYTDGPRPMIAVGTGVVVLLHGLVPTLLFDPHRSGCFACPPNLLAISSDPGRHDVVATWGLVAVLVVGAGFAAATLFHWSQAAGVVRRATGPVALPGAAVAALGSLGGWHALTDPGSGFDHTLRVLWLAECTGVTIMGLGVAVRLALAHRLRTRVADLVLDVLPDAERLRSELARTLGDPSLSISFPRDGIGVEGDDGGRAQLRVMRGSRVVAQVTHDATLNAVPDRLTSAVQAAGLALEHAGEQARLHAELDDLSELRTRIVSVGDAERRRLERNLHDGAQQRLIALAVALQSASDLPLRGDLARADAEVRTALAELRAIAHGIHPVTLTDAGLAAALRGLTEDVAVPVRIDSLPDRRGDPTVETATYRVIADIIRCAEVTDPDAVVHMRVDLGPVDLCAVVRVAGADPGPYSVAVATAAERLQALGGELRVSEGLLAEMRTPCAS